MSTHRGRTSKRAGLSTERITAKAVELTEQHGLDGWSIRDIAKALDVAPSVIYHYFPKKDELCDAVVNAVTASVPLPDDDLDWKAWFTALLQNYYPVYVRYHGITDRLSRGVFSEAFLPIIDRASKKLLEAGFGAMMPLAYSMIFNVASSTISSHNHRVAARPEDRQSLSSMIERIRPMAKESEGVTYLLNQLYLPLQEEPADIPISKQYFDLTLEVLLDGIEHTLLPRAQGISEPLIARGDGGSGPAPTASAS